MIAYFFVFFKLDIAFFAEFFAFLTNNHIAFLSDLAKGQSFEKYKALAVTGPEGALFFLCHDSTAPHDTGSIFRLINKTLHDIIISKRG